MLLAESAQPGLGSRVLIEALLKQCLVMLLRRQVDGNDAALSWTAAVADSRLVLALEKLFEHPEALLTVQRLADIAGMSRSAFASHFERAFGQTPMAMLRAILLHGFGSRRHLVSVWAATEATPLLAIRIGKWNRPGPGTCNRAKPS